MSKFSIAAFPLAMLMLVTRPNLAMEEPTDPDAKLQHLVTEFRHSTGLVGLGAVVIRDDQLIGPGVSGERKKGSGVQLSADDLWHIGSVTKSMTATMLGRLVEQGAFGWDLSIKDVFAGVDGVHAGWDTVTLEQLLSHTSGVDPNFPFLVSFKNPAEGKDRMIARETASINVLKKNPHSTPGSTFSYSNLGYTIAGVMAEKKTGISWEQLIRRELFEPLQLQSGGFGPPQDSAGTLSQPRGHRTVVGFTVAVGTDDDNTPIIGPAGTVHLSLVDLARYAHEHLKGMQGKSELLKTETYQRLHKPMLDNYAFGWMVNNPKSIGLGPVIWHNGSNTFWYAFVALIPDINAVIAVTSNAGNIELAEQTALDIVKKMFKP